MFINFHTNPNIKYGEIKEDENKIKRFLFDNGYDLGKRDKKSARYRAIKRIIGVKDDVYGRGLNSAPDQGNCLACHEQSSLDNQKPSLFADPNSLIERLKLLILETKAGHDELYDEMLDISKQILSKNVINPEELDIFFNYGK